jgi:hypothetical protein
LSDVDAQAQLSDAARAAAEAVQSLIAALKEVSKVAPEAPQITRKGTFSRYYIYS